MFIFCILFKRLPLDCNSALDSWYVICPQGPQENTGAVSFLVITPFVFSGFSGTCQSKLTKGEQGNQSSKRRCHGDELYLWNLFVVL